MRLVWTAAILFCVAAMGDQTLTGHWRFANAAPAVLVALFVTAFLYEGVIDYFAADRLTRTGSRWAFKALRADQANRVR